MWTLAGIYADRGVSGTDMSKREEFLRMLEDCMNGKVDMVITKSISRFGRNTVDLLQNVRRLKEKNIPVFFEKENINTMESSGEIMITLLSSLAQEESRNLSENTRWGIIRRFENGKIQVNHKKFMGYTKNDEDELVIVEEEAKIVKRIFKNYLEGQSISQIKAGPENDQVRTKTGLDIWNEGTIDRMLSN